MRTGETLRIVVVLALAFGAAAASPLNAQSTPSRKASVVIPLLIHWAANHHQADENLAGVEKLLGQPDIPPLGGGPQNRFSEGSYYVLDDRRQILIGEAITPRPGLAIVVITPGNPAANVTIFSTKASETH